MGKIKITIAKKAEFVYFISFFLGILLANILGFEQLEQYGILNEYFIKQLLYVSINYNELFLYVVENRGVIFLLLLVFSITRLGMPVHFLYIAWNGFSFGVAMVSVIANFGIKGILVLCGFLFPQYLFYVLLYLLIFVISCYWQERQESGQNPSLGIPKVMLVAVVIVLLVGFFMLGVITESYVNPYIIEKIVKIL